MLLRFETNLDTAANACNDCAIEQQLRRRLALVYLSDTYHFINSHNIVSLLHIWSLLCAIHAFT